LNRLALFLALFLLPAVPALAAPADPCAAAIPDTPFAATVAGKPLPLGPATIYPVSPWLGHYVTYYLTFQDKPGDAMLQVQVLVKKKQLPDGRTFRMLPSFDPAKQPSVGKDATEIQSWTFEVPAARIDTAQFHDLATLTVTFGMRKDGKLPGKLALCIPAQKATFLGAFSATITQ
jgi:hypothetical protein